MTQRKYHVRYYAALREQRGVSEEHIESNAATPQDLYLELAKKFQFTLKPYLVRFAVSDEFVDADFQLSDGDTVMLLPPVAGG